MSRWWPGKTTALSAMRRLTVASARWMRHVAELRVVVAQSVRGIGVGRLLLELAFEMVLDMGVTKVIARMTPEQSGALKLFQRLGFAEEAVLRDHALDANGVTHDLQVLSFHTRRTANNVARSAGSRSWKRGPGRRPALLELLRITL